ncbi:MAG: TlpA family protein disulfide reductase, partial [Gemmatimonadaceae bacterium]
MSHIAGARRARCGESGAGRATGIGRRVAKGARRPARGAGRYTSAARRAARWTRGFAFALGTVLLASPLAAQDEIGIKRGTSAPGAIVETLDGKSVDLKSYFGKVPVVIEFWATWCPNCKQLEPAFHSVAKKYAGKVRLLGVAVSVNQSVERVKAYADRHGLPLEVLYDRRGYASDAYEVP